MEKQNKLSKTNEKAKGQKVIENKLENKEVIKSEKLRYKNADEIYE